ncbi:MAG TPA: CdaR family protein, partial [Flavobacteriaceae bacterium]|nr:CdaR family protein [Flavobacteriaceae bacterium]
NHDIKVDFNKDVYVKDNNFVWIASKFKHKISAQLGNAAEVISLEHDTVKFPFETLSVKKVPVVLNSKVVFKPGYDVLGHFTIQPDSIDVIGSANELSQINKAETETLQLKDVTDTINEVLLLKKLEDNKLKFSQNSVKVTAKVEKFTEGMLSVPVTIINKPIDVSINYFPKTVDVSYYVSLSNYKNIKPLDFKVECDFSEIKNANKTFFTPKLVKVPELVKNARLKQNKVEFILMQ